MAWKANKAVRTLVYDHVTLIIDADWLLILSAPKPASRTYAHSTPWCLCSHTATRRVGKILLVVSGKTVSDFLKIHTFLMFLFKTIFNGNYKKLQALKLAFKSFSSKMSMLAIF